MTTQLRPTDREDIAQRLLRSSAKASYDPLTEIDWAVPLDESRYAMPARRVSLYGTPLWDRLSDAKRKELSRHEVASIACVGIWFETILMQMLVRHAYDGDPTTSHVQYAYTEIADECRHSVMFARFVKKMGAPHYQLDPLGQFLGRLFKATSNGPLTFSAALFVEELLDQMQREAMADDQVEPFTRAVARIHVIEEARHMRYAREELIRDWPQRSAVTRAWSAVVLALVARTASERLVSRACYARVGLDPREARRAARRNLHWRAARAWFARNAVETFAAAGLISGPARFIWRRAGLIGPAGTTPADS
ncbi:MAG: AurF N-oxygenase family protein [Streptosporangiaceae bacterium]